MFPKYLNFVGLLFAMAGAITLACGLIIPGKDALNIGTPRLAGDNDRQNQCLPQVRDRIRESRFAFIGIILMAVGFLLQIIGSWPEF